MKPFQGDMTNKTKKQLADAICKALFGKKFVCYDRKCSASEDYEILGFVDINPDDIAGREPVLVYVTDNGVEIHWMFDEALNLGDDGMSGFLIGVMHAVEPSMPHQETDSRTIMFAYPDTPEQ